MLLFDWPLEKLKTCQLPQTKEADFDEFWDSMLARSRSQPLHPKLVPGAYVVPEIQLEAVSFEAFDGGRIVGWSISPKPVQPRPTLIFFHGYAGNKTHVANYLMWALQGFTCLTFDVRGQSGDSTDTAPYPGGCTPGWLTRGILEPQSYYLARCYVDTVRALDFACGRPEVDASRIGVTGCSQGGGLSLAACSLDPRPALCMAEVPGFCHIGRTLELTQEAPWTELINYFRSYPERVEPAMRSMSYIELNNLTERIQCPALVNAANVDLLCVPSSIYSAFNRIPHPDKHIEFFPYNGHEGGLMIETMIQWVRKHLLAER